MTRAEAMGLRPSADSWAYRELGKLLFITENESSINCEDP